MSVLTLDCYSAICSQIGNLEVEYCYDEDVLCALNLQATCRTLYFHLIPEVYEVLRLAYNDAELICTSSNAIIQYLLSKRPLTQDAIEVSCYEMRLALNDNWIHSPYLCHAYCKNCTDWKEFTDYSGDILEKIICSPIDRDVVLEFSRFHRKLTLIEISREFQTICSSKDSYSEDLLDLFLLISDDSYYDKPLKITEEDKEVSLFTENFLMFLYCSKKVEITRRELGSIAGLIQDSLDTLEYLPKLHRGKEVYEMYLSMKQKFFDLFPS